MSHELTLEIWIMFRYVCTMQVNYQFVFTSCQASCNMQCRTARRTMNGVDSRGNPLPDLRVTKNVEGPYTQKQPS